MSEDIRVDRNGTPFKRGDLFVFIKRGEILSGDSLRFYVTPRPNSQISYRTILTKSDISDEFVTVYLGTVYTAQIIPRDVARKGAKEIILCLKLGGLKWTPEQEELLLTNQEKIMETYEKQYRTLSPHP